MTPEHGNAEEELAQAIGRELKRPVPVRSNLPERVMAEVHRLGPAPEIRGTRRWARLAIAAVLAGLGVMFGLRSRPGSSDPVEQVAFALEMPGAARVALIGDFNDWDFAATPLHLVSQDGRWEAIVPLEPGRYQFTFVVDGVRWVADPAQPRAQDDFGEPTSVITVIGPSRL